MIARQDGLLRYVEQHLLEPVLTGDSINDRRTFIAPPRMTIRPDCILTGELFKRQGSGLVQTVILRFSRSA